MQFNGFCVWSIEQLFKNNHWTLKLWNTNQITSELTLVRHEHTKLSMGGALQLSANCLAPIQLFIVRSMTQFWMLHERWRPIVELSEENYWIKCLKWIINNFNGNERVFLSEWARWKTAVAWPTDHEMGKSSTWNRLQLRFEIFIKSLRNGLSRLLLRQQYCSIPFKGRLKITWKRSSARAPGKMNERKQQTWANSPYAICIMSCWTQAILSWHSIANDVQNGFEEIELKFEFSLTFTAHWLIFFFVFFSFRFALLHSMNFHNTIQLDGKTSQLNGRESVLALTFVRFTLEFLKMNSFSLGFLPDPMLRRHLPLVRNCTWWSFQFVYLWSNIFLTEFH